ncbi:MAG TPA: (2Fe-2S) ferredoxin domain-containing protein [Candidatus Angelobacter sp.]|nr:(2Fe-2S) ferredoxin domain-containing protein [Candidatus Angelobacter sp.]
MTTKAIAPGLFSDLQRQDGSTKTVRILEGQIFVCQGCCCGRSERKNPEVPVEAFKTQWKQRGLRLRFHLTFTACLGPCVAANVVLLLFAGESLWLHSINSEAEVNLIYDHAEALLASGAFAMPSGRLAKHVFSRYMSPAEVLQRTTRPTMAET